MNLEFERFLPGSPERVFSHFTEPGLLTSWWPSGAEIDLRAGGSYHFWWDGPGWHLRGKYREVAPPDRLSFTWSWDHDDLDPRVVDLTLEQTDQGTQLVIHHEAESEEEREGYETGWTHFLGLLAEHLASSDD